MDTRILAPLLLAAVGAPALAGTIVSPTAVLQNTLGEPFGATAGIAHTIDQSGLSAGFTSGVTDFDTYLAGTPLHTLAFINAEWFGNAGAGTIVYDLGSALTIQRIAFWNEEAIGTASMVVHTSNDPLFGSFTTVGTFASLTDNPAGSDYAAQVLTLTASTARYVRLDVTGPQNGAGATAFGEIAFDVGAVAPVPEPGTFALFGLGAAALSVAAARRRRKQSARA